MKRDKLGKLDVQTPTGDYMVQNNQGLFLLRGIDGWGKEKPEFVEKDFAMRFTKKQAEEQKQFCWWNSNKIFTEIVRESQK